MEAGKACFQAGTGYGGGYHGEVPSIASPRDCLKECREKGGCTIFYWAGDTNICWLKKPGTTPHSNSDAVSGLISDCESIEV